MKNDLTNDLMNDYIKKLEILEKILEKNKEDSTTSVDSDNYQSDCSIQKLNILNEDICKKLDKINEDLIIDKVSTESNSVAETDSIQRFQKKIQEVNKSRNQDDKDIKKDLVKISYILFKEFGRVTYLMIVLFFVSIISLTVYYLSNKENISLYKIFKTIIKTRNF
ncbi:hypothetical protein CPAV1605_526 [seawater metagenome]|uniref:Uncharacterized protein n=1 Tax=seawater metagenome TaxID=1561972 RepID=A0A5E8CHT8_9ZZZZ